MNPQKMVVIPYEKYMKLKETYNKSVNNSSVTNVDDENDSKEEEKRVKLTNNDEENKDMLTEDDILMYMPKIYKEKSKMILHHMKNNKMYWDSFGRLILDNQCIVESHIVDLIKDVICSFKRKEYPQISKEFCRILINSHCPRSILNKSLSNNDSINQ